MVNLLICRKKPSFGSAFANLQGNTFPTSGTSTCVGRFLLVDIDS